MTIAVVGADGQLGSDICTAIKEQGYTLVPLTIKDIDIADADSVNKSFGSFQDIDMVINTAAMHNVPDCEKDPQKSFAVNGLGALNLARVCNKMDAALIHISTDYVFDGNKRAPYVETDPPLPLNVYGNTKLSGEYFIQALAKKYYVFRVSGLYGKHPCLAKGYNFVDLMLKLAGEREEVRVVDNEILTPTFTEDVAAQILHIIKHQPPAGLYHCTAEGDCSWYDFAREIFSISKSQITLNRAAPGEFAPAFERPEYSVLENQKLKDHNLNIMQPWQDALKRYITANRL